MSAASVGGVRVPTRSSACAPNSTSPAPTRSWPASMIGIWTAKRCGSERSSASMRATTSCVHAASPASRAGPRPMLRGERDDLDRHRARGRQLVDRRGERGGDRTVTHDDDLVGRPGLLLDAGRERRGEVIRPVTGPHRQQQRQLLGHRRRPSSPTDSNHPRHARRHADGRGPVMHPRRRTGTGSGGGAVRTGIAIHAPAAVTRPATAPGGPAPADRHGRRVGPRARARPAARGRSTATSRRASRPPT